MYDLQKTINILTTNLKHFTPIRADGKSYITLSFERDEAETLVKFMKRFYAKLWFMCDEPRFAEETTMLSPLRDESMAMARSDYAVTLMVASASVKNPLKYWVTVVKTRGRRSRHAFETLAQACEFIQLHTPEVGE